MVAFSSRVIIACLACASSALSLAVASSAAAQACAQIKAASFTGSQYNNDIAHWSNASSAVATCTVEPATPADIQTLFKIIKSTRAPWAVKGIGHCNNPNMSATTGVQITMYKFNQVIISPDHKSVTIGPGNFWSAVYEKLDPLGIAIVGGRLNIVGVGGLVLSGGYSTLTNQYGFAMDNTLAYDIVTYDGQIRHVTQQSSPDLFFALQGGVNNFGIVTAITTKAYQIKSAWGGSVILTGDPTPLVNAVAKFDNTTTDVKATVTLALNAVPGGKGNISALAILYYNSTNGPPKGLFDGFLNIPNATYDIKQRPYGAFASLFTLAPQPTLRATWHSAPTTAWPTELVNYIKTQAQYYADVIGTKSGVQVSGNIEPFLPSAYMHRTDTAWPHTTPYNTFNGLFIWTNASDDEWMFRKTKEYHDSVKIKAISLGLAKSDALYPPNYSDKYITPQQIYGPNLPRLQKIQKSIDPWKINALTGGFKILG